MISEWRLEMYAAGVLSGEDKNAFEKALKEDDTLRARLAGLQDASSQFFVTYDAASTIARIKRSARPQRMVQFSMAAAAVLGIFAVFFFILPRTPQEDTRFKGGASLLVYRQNSGSPELLGNGASVEEGEVLQLAYRASGARYGAILSIDGRGHVTQHFPERGDAAAPLQGHANLPFAYQLDDAPSFEKFYFFTGGQPFKLDGCIAAINGAELPSGVSKQEFDLRKGAP